jgi:thiol:disulfide interchange protein DsbD
MIVLRTRLGQTRLGQTRLGQLLALLLLVWVGTLSSTAMAGKTPPFAAVAEPVDVKVGQPTTLSVRVVVPQGCKVYRDMMGVEVVDAAGLTLGKPSFPPAEKTLDPVFGVERELYRMDVWIELAVGPIAAAGVYLPVLDVRWQGCKDKLCYLPQTEQVTATITVAEPSTWRWPSLIATAHAGDEESPVQVSVSVDGEKLRVDFTQKPGWHLTEMMTFLELAEGQTVKLGEQKWPQAHQRPDPAIPGATRGEYDGNFSVVTPILGEAGEHPVKGTVGYQACKAEKCLLPAYHDFDLTVTLTGVAGSQAVGATQASTPAAAPNLSGGTGAEPLDAAPFGGGVLADAAAKGSFWLVLFTFGAGFLVSLTPCVLPMIPITMGIIGAQSGGSRLQGFLLSLTYVAGLATVYTILGVSAAMAGSIFGSWMQSVWVVGTVAVFFVVMGFAMFGFFEIGVPSSVQTKLGQKGGAGFVGSFVVGAVGAVVAGPCSGPVIASLMVLIGQQGQLALGAALMVAFSLGMGVLFLIAGTFSGVLFRPGVWMDSIKKSFGVLMWLGAIYFVSAHLSEAVVAGLTALVLLSTAVFAWPADEEMEGVTLARGKKLYSVVGGMVGGYLLLGLLVTKGFILPPMNLSASGGAAEQGPHLQWEDDEPAALARASAEGKPLIIDFTADWCAACKELEHFTYSDPAVIARSAAFVPVMIDATRGDDPVVKGLIEKYGVQGLPTVLFLQPNGTVIKELTLVGFEPAAGFLPRMESALEAL